MQLAHEEAGEGPAVVLIHAGVADRRMWDPQWATFPRVHRVVRYDARGFGQSPLPPGSWSDARDLIALLETIGVDRATLVGASRGGRIALEAALTRPDLVGGLVLACAGLPGHTWKEQDRLTTYAAAVDAAVRRGDLDAAVEANLRMWVDGPRRSPADVDPDVRELVRVMQRRALELQAPAWDDLDDRNRLLVPDYGERLGQLRARVLVLAGGEDMADLQAMAERLAREIPGAHHAVIGGAGHLPNLERPAEFDRQVLDFLAT